MTCQQTTHFARWQQLYYLYTSGSKKKHLVQRVEIKQKLNIFCWNNLFNINHSISLTLFLAFWNTWFSISMLDLAVGLPALWTSSSLEKKHTNSLIKFKCQALTDVTSLHYFLSCWHFDIDYISRSLKTTCRDQNKSSSVTFVKESVQLLLLLLKCSSLWHDFSLGLRFWLVWCRMAHIGGHILQKCFLRKLLRLLF